MKNYLDDYETIRLAIALAEKHPENSTRLYNLMAKRDFNSVRHYIRRKGKPSETRNTVLPSNTLPIPDKNNKIMKQLDFFDALMIPENSFIYFCSMNHKPIDPELAEMPPVKYLWAQLKLPKEYGEDGQIPTMRDSWFCGGLPGEDHDSFYVYRTKRPLTLLFGGNDPRYIYGEKAIEANESLKDKIRFSGRKHPSDYVNTDILHKMLNIDGLYNNYSELILFSPYDDKLEFVSATIGETLADNLAALGKKKSNWEGTNIQRLKEDIYFNADNSLVKQFRNAILKTDYADKARKYLKGGRGKTKRAKIRLSCRKVREGKRRITASRRSLRSVPHQRLCQ